VEKTKEVATSPLQRGVSQDCAKYGKFSSRDKCDGVAVTYRSGKHLCLECDKRLLADLQWSNRISG